MSIIPGMCRCSPSTEDFSPPPHPHTHTHTYFHTQCSLEPVISLQGVYNAYSHLIKSSQQLQSGVRCEVYAASTGDLITTSTPPVLRDITLSANPRPAPNPRVTVDTAICLRILTKFSQPCYLYIINIGMVRNNFV